MPTECHRHPPQEHPKSSHVLNPRWKWNGGTTERDVKYIRRARNEGSRVEWGGDCKAGIRHTTMAFLGVGLMPSLALRADVIFIHMMINPF